MKTLLILIALSLVSTSWAQSPDERRAERMRQREALHQKMFQALQGDNLDRSLRDMEKMMNEMMSDMQMDMQEFNFSSRTSALTPFTYDWRMNEKGRSLVITPQSKETKLDVKVENQLLTIQSNMKQGEAKRIMSVPQDCDPDRVKMEEKDGNLVLFFPFKSKESGLKPLSGGKNDVQT